MYVRALPILPEKAGAMCNPATAAALIALGLNLDSEALTIADNWTTDDLAKTIPVERTAWLLVAKDRKSMLDGLAWSDARIIVSPGHTIAYSAANFSSNPLTRLKGNINWIATNGVVASNNRRVNKTWDGTLLDANSQRHWNRREQLRYRGYFVVLADSRYLQPSGRFMGPKIKLINAQSATTQWLAAALNGGTAWDPKTFTQQQEVFPYFPGD